MPYYDYKCIKCDKTIELFHSMSYNKAVECEKCSSIMNKIISGGTGVIFNGSGFYHTDYKQKGK